MLMLSTEGMMFTIGLFTLHLAEGSAAPWLQALREPLAPSSESIPTGTFLTHFK